MLPFVATSLATAAAILIFGAVARPVFPTYQVESFRVVDFSVSYPSWMGFSLLAWPSFSSCNSDPSSWRCYFWDWEGLCGVINSVEREIMQNLMYIYSTDQYRHDQQQEQQRDSLKHQQLSNEAPLIRNQLLHNDTQLLLNATLQNDSPYKWSPQNAIHSFLENYLNIQISAHIHAGISIDNNANQFGAHVHRVALDVYHEDLNGILLNIGSVQDRISNSGILVQRGSDVNDKGAIHADNEYDSTDEVEVSWNGTTSFQKTNSLRDLYNSSDDADSLVYELWRDKNGTTHREATSNTQNEDLTQNVVLPPKASSWSYQYQNPSFTVSPRTITHTADDAVSISLRNLSPQTYISMLRHILVNRGVLHIPSSGVIHLKTTSSLVPFTVGVVCENEIQVSLSSLVSIPSFATLLSRIINKFRRYDTGNIQLDNDLPWIRIEKVDCSLERLSTGWWDTTKMGEELKSIVRRRHQETGAILGGVAVG